MIASSCCFGLTHQVIVNLGTVSSILIQVVTCSNPLFGHRHHVPAPRTNRGKSCGKIVRKIDVLSRKSTYIAQFVSFFQPFSAQTLVFLSVKFTPVHCVGIATQMDN